MPPGWISKKSRNSDSTESEHLRFLNTTGALPQNKHTTFCTPLLHQVAIDIAWQPPPWAGSAVSWLMFRAHRKGEPYTSPCYLWLTGAVVLADLALVMVGLLMAQNTTFGAVLPVAGRLVLRFLNKRLSHR